MNYENPIIKGFHPDPSICKVGKDYYIVTSSFEFLPGVPIFHSKDLVHWKQIGHCITRAEQMEFTNCYHNAGIFAPTLRYHEGIFYMTTTNVAREGAFAPEGSGNFIMTALRPEGPWSNPKWVDQGGIDPSLFWDEDGKVYFTSTKHATNTEGEMINAIYQAEINPDTGELLSESRIISYGCGGRFAEAPHVYKKDGYYYLLLAEGGTEFGHMVTVSRSTSIWGPFKPCPKNPILTASQSNDPSLAATGHGDLIEDHEGNWWMVFLCYRLSENYHHHMGRETAIAPVEWVDGWPVVNGGKVPGEYMEVDRKPLWDDEAYLVEVQSTDLYGNRSCRSEFQGEDLGMEWNFFREFLKEYSLSKNPGFLTLFGNSHTLNDKATPAFIGRRIENFEFRAQCSVDFEPMKENEEAGLAIAHNPNGHYEFVVTKRAGVKKVILRKTVYDMVVESEGVEAPTDSDSVQLQILGDRYDLIFSVKREDQYQEVGRGLVKLISSEVIGGCIGSYIGMYASGNGVKTENEAKFAWFDYEELPKKKKRGMFFEE